eukprot:Em0018g67a
MGRKSPSMQRDEQLTVYNQFLLESTIGAEYAQLLQHPVPGVYVLPSDASSLIWYGLMFIRVGIYQNAIFKFTLSIPRNYPDGGCPDFDFQSGVFHPLVDYVTGQLDTRSEFQKWRRDINHIHNLLMYARNIFHTIDTTHAVNQEAARLYRHDFEKYKRRVQDSIEACRQEALNPDPSDVHGIRTGEWQTAVMRAAREQIFEPELKADSESGSSAQTSGMSWVKAGTYEPFSKEDA